MKELKKILIDFCIINTGTMFGTLAYTHIFVQEYYIRKNILLQIAIIAFCASVANTYLNKIEFKGSVGSAISILINYIGINNIIVGGAILFGWIDKRNIKEIIDLTVIVFFIYVVVYISIYIRDKKTANRINDRIKEYNSRE